MTAQHLLHDLVTRGVVLSADGDQLVADGLDSVLDESLDAIRAHKAALLELLSRSQAQQPQQHTHPRPRLGSFARPMPVRGTWMPTECLWHTCNGDLTSRHAKLYECQSCATWFELMPPGDLGVYVGDLADDFDGHADETEWLM